MKKVKLLLCALLSVTLLGSCGKSGADKSEWYCDYLPVQMSNGDNWSIIDKNGKEVVKEEYPADASISEVVDGAYWVKQGDKYQLFSIDSPKKPIIDDEFTGVTKFASGVSAVSSSDQPIRIINVKGKTVATLPKSIKKCLPFSLDGYAIFFDTDNKQGLINAKGEIVIKADDQNFIGRENEGLVLVRKNNDDKKVQILDVKGKKQGEIDEEKYEILTVFNDGKMTVCVADDNESPIIVLDKTGKKLFSIKKSSGSKSGGYAYLDGYIVFRNDDGKYGVADDKGETVIRPKYDGMAHIGDGIFVAKKKDKIGIINVDDEPVIDFDYDGFACCMGDNYLVVDNSDYTLIDKNGKEVTSFSRPSFNNCDSYVEYVDVKGLTDETAKEILKLATPMTAQQVAGVAELGLDDCHYKSWVRFSNDIDEKVYISASIYLNGSMAEEMSHLEEVNDGWFTSTRWVSDGWKWSEATTDSASATISFVGFQAKPESICKALIDKIVEAGYKKVDDNTYSKNIKLEGKTYESRVSLTPEDDKINVNINFNE